MRPPDCREQSPARVFDVLYKRSPNAVGTFPNAVSFNQFHITFQYPRADVYPHFLSAEIKRVDNSAFGVGVSGQQWRGKPALQLSRKSNRLDPAIDTAATKLAKVITWFKNL